MPAFVRSVAGQEGAVVRMGLVVAIVLGSARVGAGEPVSPPVEKADRRLAGGDSHTFEVEMKAGDALFGRVVQRGVDLVVAVRDPAGRVALEVDSPNGAQGPEPLAFVASSAGRHALEVRAFEATAAAGAYDLHLDAVRPATPAQRQIAEALIQGSKAMTSRNEALRLQGQAEFAASSRLYTQARADAARALDLRRRALGPDDAQLAPLHSLLGLIDDEIGDYASGKAHFQRALALLEKSQPGQPSTITTRSDLGYLALANGDWSEAVDLFTRSNAERERLNGPDHVSLANGMVGLGEAYWRLGQLERAEEVLRRGLAIREKAAGAGHQSLSWFWTRLGEVLASRRRFAEAEELCGRALQVAESGHANRLHAASAHACLGATRVGRGDTAAGIANLREALRIREAAGGPDHPWTAEASAALGAALIGAKQAAEGGRLLARAERIQAKRLRPGHPALAQTRRHLAALRPARAGGPRA
jgi:tetratricopeptide (TPR) repeat protein